MNLRILALDPGGTTGYAHAVKDGDNMFVTYGQQRLNHYEFYDFLLSYPSDYLICESFEFRQGNQLGVDLIPVELIGIVKLYAYLKKPQAIYFQPASKQGKKAYFSDARLKDMGLYLKGLEHGRSAVKHLLDWYVFGAGYKFAENGPGEFEPRIELVDYDWINARWP